MKNFILILFLSACLTGYSQRVKRDTVPVEVKDKDGKKHTEYVIQETFIAGHAFIKIVDSLDEKKKKKPKKDGQKDKVIVS
jgi:hypothetical protein